MNTNNLNKVAESLKRAGYEARIANDHIVVIVKHGHDKNVRNAIPMWQWFWYGIRAATIHEHKREEIGNDIIEITVR
jgi:hypothetical protein